MPIPAPISPLPAVLLGIVEGLTEFLPISSTGHLILAATALGLDLRDPGVSAFLIVIQAGALMAVAGIYRKSVWGMIKGIAGRSPEGLRLLGLLAVAFLPAAIAGAAFGNAIKERLFRPEPVALALGLGGVFMILIENHRARRASAQLAEPEDISPANSREAASPNASAHFDAASITWLMALAIGLAQCAAFWPGVSRSMATILAALLLGMKPKHAAEFSFLLALPTLGAATAHDLWRDGARLFDAAGASGLALGFAFAWLAAAISVKGLLGYLNRRGLAPFGWYRVALAVLIYRVWGA